MLRMTTKYVVRNNETILRKEFFGGIAFNTKRAITLELDKEAFYLLSILKNPSTLDSLKVQLCKKFSRDFSDSKINQILDTFIQQEFIESKRATQSIEKVKIFLVNDGLTKTLSAPETVHLSITGRCNLNCRFCYSKSKTDDLSTAEIFSLIDELSSMGVFQLAIGGGEPFLRKDIFDIVDYCKQKNVVANITSNGSLITDDICRKIRNKVGQVNISYNEAFAANKFKNAISILFTNNIRTGVNLLVTKKVLTDLDNIVKRLLNENIVKIIILRPKPCDNKDWYKENRLKKKELFELKYILDKYNNNRINVDCSLTCLMHDIPKQELKEKAVYGCVAGIRFCTIKNNGDVFPCSFFNTKKFLAGKILSYGFKTIWQKSERFKKFRKMNNHIGGYCSSCEIRDYCKGCRRIVLESEKNFYSEEIECPKDQV